MTQTRRTHAWGLAAGCIALTVCWLAAPRIGYTVGQFLTDDTNQTITATHTFNPVVAGAPFVLGANAQNQKVTGLNADKLDGQEGSFYQDAGNLTTGALADARLSSNVPFKNASNTFTASQTISPGSTQPPFVLGANAQNQKVIGLDADRLDGQEGSFYQSATNLTSGTLADARLSSNVPLKNVVNTFAAQQQISPGTVQPPLVLGANAQNQKVVGLNADRLDGQEGSFYQNAGNLTAGILPLARFPTYGARVRHNAAQSIPGDGTNHALAFNAERYDPENMHGTATNNSRLTAPVAGAYLIIGSIRIKQENSGGTSRRLGIFRLDTGTIAAQSWTPNTLANFDVTISTVYYLEAGDYVELKLSHNSSTALVVESASPLSPEFSMTWLHP